MSYCAITVYDTRDVARATCSGRPRSEEPGVSYGEERMEQVSKGDRVFIGCLLSQVRVRQKWRHGRPLSVFPIDITL